jgi:hypothetical protein
MGGASDYELRNPALIFDGDRRYAPEKRLAPLVLVHDGGGTTFSYHCLDPTNRPLYGIENPHLHQGGFWDGGVPEMASAYVGLMEAAFPEGGDVLLGGNVVNSFPRDKTMKKKMMKMKTPQG